MTTALSIPDPVSRHAKIPCGKTKEATASKTPSPLPRSMAELARQIIRQQWPNRHHPDPSRRKQALTLIRTHAFLLRQWRKESEQGGKIF